MTTRILALSLSLFALSACAPDATEPATQDDPSRPSPEGKGDTPDDCSPYVDSRVCSPNDELVCENTGGIVENGTCQCETTEVARGFEWLPEQGGCDFPDLVAAEIWLDPERVAEYDLGALVDPAQGITIIHKPGVHTAISVYDTLAQAYDGHYGLETLLSGRTCPLTYGGAPGLDAGCEFVEAGCFADRIDNDEWSRLSTVMNDVNTFVAEGAYSEADIELVRSYEQSGTFVELTITESYASLVFERVDGTWWLRVIDIALHDCGA